MARSLFIKFGTYVDPITSSFSLIIPNRPFKRTLPRHDQNFEDIFYNQCMTSAMSEYLFRFEAIKVEKNMAVKGKGQKPKNEVKSKKYQTFRGDMLQLKESRAILLH